MYLLDIITITDLKISWPVNVRVNQRMNVYIYVLRILYISSKILALTMMMDRNPVSETLLLCSILPWQITLGCLMQS
jgi:hypothetical protein